MKKTVLLTLAVTLLFAAAPCISPAAEVAGVTMDDTIRIGQSTAVLTGMGIRTKTLLKVKVYVAGLYMEKPSSDTGDIIGSDQPKAMVMTFLYKEVESEKLQESWREGFEANTPAAGSDLKERMEGFISLFTEPARKGDTYVFAYEPGIGTSVIIGGDARKTIPGADFAGALMAIWFGEKPGDGGLKALKKSILEGM